MRRLGMKTEEVEGVVEVIVRTKTKEHVFESPEVTVLTVRRGPHLPGGRYAAVPPRPAGTTPSPPSAAAAPVAPSGPPRRTFSSSWSRPTFLGSCCARSSRARPRGPPRGDHGAPHPRRRRHQPGANGAPSRGTRPSAPSTPDEPIARECVEGYLFARDPFELLIFRLLLRRGSIWVPISGRSTGYKDVDFDSALDGELEEETGLTHPLRVDPLDWHVTFRPAQREVWRLHAYAVEVARVFRPRLSHEHVDMNGWGSRRPSGGSITRTTARP